ncbi:hypothetical protein WISP_50313 [Willisornis vidua]|uniref:Rna-directed dna polymerase from mobile element jockey-like n=1 Tax=Willisornis vidua TaxID=1566151 RepID=A0ABQ9DGT5_9PASS|nr:hypothetical protein WISP_50313 [Willisornis vidua]
MGLFEQKYGLEVCLNSILMLSVFLYDSDKVTHLVDEEKVVKVFYPDFSKAIDTVSHSILLEKLSAHGMDCLLAKEFTENKNQIKPTTQEIQVESGLKPVAGISRPNQECYPWQRTYYQSDLPTGKCKENDLGAEKDIEKLEMY